MTEEIRSNISTVSGKLYLCDMRYGPAEDGFDFSLGKGSYAIQHLSLQNGSRVVRVQEKDHTQDKEKTRGRLSTELNCFGIFDRASLIDEFGSFEHLYEWGEGEVYRQCDKEIFDVTTPRGSRIHCFRAGENEGDYEVVELYKAGRLIGFEVRIPRSEYEVEPVKSQAIIYRVEIKYRKAKLEAYIYSEFDRDAILDTFRETVLDYISENEDARLEQIINNSEPDLELDAPLDELDSRFSEILKFNVYKQIGNSKQTLFYTAGTDDTLPENAIGELCKRFLEVTGM